MYYYALLAAMASSVLCLPAPAPAPEPLPLPNPQFAQLGGIETDPISGLISGLIQGAVNLPSFQSAVPALLTDVGGILDAATTVTEAIANGTIAGTDVPVVIQKLFQAVEPTATPTSIPDALSKAASSFSITDPNAAPPTTQNLLANVLGLVLEGFTSSDIEAVKSGADPFANSYSNNNRPVPASQNFYNTVSGNAPFDVQEEKLRAALYVPPAFTWGNLQPILFSPGTGATGTVNFASNIGKLLAADPRFDPVYLNIPDNLLGDAQVSAEYVAYALQYLHAVTGKKPAIITWSQGSLDAQWAFKYWPSIPAIMTDHIAISPDYHGTVLAYALCPGFAAGNSIACTPSIVQQDYNSNFVKTLRRNGGDSAYVPTTTVYSATDEIVQPQQGTAASGFLLDARNVGVSNTFLQGACAGLPAGLLYTHEGVLYNPVAYALVVDALTHDGPGAFDRVEDSCQDIVAPGLSLADVVQTESLIPLAVLIIFAFVPKSVAEPAIKSYASY